MKNLTANSRTILLMSCAAGALAVAIGAFGAHALKPVLQATGRIDVFETGVRYHFYHSLALLALGILSIHLHYKQLLFSGFCFLGGIFFFSGSLYLISIWPSLSFLGPVTPLGGILFIVGWALLGWTVIQNKNQLPG